MRLKRHGDTRQFEIESAPQNDVTAAEGGSNFVRITINGREIAATVTPMPDGSAVVDIDGRRARVAAARERSSIMVAAGPLTAEFSLVEGRGADAR
jgi:hypothetical protein